MTRMTLLLFFLPLVAIAAPKIERELVPERPGQGEIMNFVVSIETDNSSQVEPAKFPDVAGLSFMGVNQSTQMTSTYVNGRFETKQTRSFTYQLVAQKKGELRIPALTFNVDGKVMRTDELRVAVGAPGAGGGRPRARRGFPDPFGQMDDMEELFNRMLQRPLRDPPPPPTRPGGRNNPDGFEQKPANPDDAFFIQASVDKKKAYVGEQITANFYLVTRGLVRDIDTLRYPDLKGFWKEDLEMATRLNFETVVIDGVQYQRALLVSYALFPIRAGKTVIDGYKAKCTVLTPQTMGLGRAYQFTKESPPIDVEVLELPQPKPADFTGAVGSYQVTAAFEPNVGSVNQPVTLRVRFQGQGNAKLIELPKLKLPDGFEIFETKSQAKFAKDGSSFKEFEVLIIPRQPGTFAIEPVMVSIFDPQAKTYVTAKSAALDLTISGRATAAPAPTPVVPTKPTATSDDPSIPEIAGELGPTPWPSIWTWIITAVVFLASCGALAFQTFKLFTRKPRRATLAALTTARVAKARELGARKEWRRVGVELTNSIYFILGQLSEQGGANLELGRLLERLPPSLRQELGSQLRDVLERCERLSFAPDAVNIELANPHQIELLVTDFERVVGRAIDLAEIE